DEVVPSGGWLSWIATCVFRGVTLHNDVILPGRPANQRGNDLQLLTTEDAGLAGNDENLPTCVNRMMRIRKRAARFQNRTARDRGAHKLLEVVRRPWRCCHTGGGTAPPAPPCRGRAPARCRTGGSPTKSRHRRRDRYRRPPRRWFARWSQLTW